jgi:hypothetical protein
MAPSAPGTPEDHEAAAVILERLAGKIASGLLKGSASTVARLEGAAAALRQEAEAQRNAKPPA